MQDLTRGPILRCLAGMAGFMVVGMLVQTLYSLIDLYWVGSLGSAAQAAVSISANLTMISLALFNMLGGGAAALVAQAIGAKDHVRVNRVYNQAIGLGVIAMIVFGVTGWALEGAYAKAFAADAETAGLIISYLRWFLPALALQFPIGAAAACLRGAGSMRPAMLVQVGSVVLNIVLAPLLIFGWLGLPALGVEGAGLATFLAGIAAALALAYYLVRRCRFLHLDASGMVPRPGLSWSILKIGLPATVDYSLLAVYLFFITGLLGEFGAAEQAAFGIGQRVMQATMMPAIALSFAAAAVAGQNYGARLPGRVRETFTACLSLSLGLAVPCLILIELLPSTLIGIFSADPEVRSAGAEFMRILSINLIAVAVATSCFGVLSGLGNTIPTMVSSAVRIALIVGPTSWLATLPGFRPVWIWEISVGAQLVQVALNLYFLRREFDRRLGRVAVAVAPAE
jgi:putative MATE family efflux protein